MFRVLFSILFIGISVLMSGCSKNEQDCCSFSPRRGPGPCFVRVHVDIVGPDVVRGQLSAEANQWWETEGKTTHEGFCLEEEYESADYVVRWIEIPNEIFPASVSMICWEDMREKKLFDLNDHKSHREILQEALEMISKTTPITWGEPSRSGEEIEEAVKEILRRKE